MKIILPYAKLMSPSPDLWGKQGNIDVMQKIEWAARISHRSEESQTETSWRRFIEEVVLKHGDWSVVEHVTATVDTVVDRGITHEWVRHRLFSYTQESTRFVNYERKMAPSFIYPRPDTECEHCLTGNEVRCFGRDKWWHELSDPNLSGQSCKYHWTWLNGIDECERAYRTLLINGWRPQEARSVFPNALASRIITTGNLRSWRHFFIMRTTAEAHPQMRQVTIPLLAEFKTSFPLLFDDIEPLAKQSESMKKAQ